MLDQVPAVKNQELVKSRVPPAITVLEWVPAAISQDLVKNKVPAAVKLDLIELNTSIHITRPSEEHVPTVVVLSRRNNDWYVTKTTEQPGT